MYKALICPSVFEIYHQFASRRTKKGTYFGHQRRTKSPLIGISFLSCWRRYAPWMTPSASPFNDILAHWKANRWCTVMLWASLSNSCVNIRILDAGDTRSLWRFRYHFFRLLAEVHIWLHRPTVTKPDQLGPSNFLGRWPRMSPNDPTRSNLWPHAR